MNSITTCKQFMNKLTELNQSLLCTEPVVPSPRRRRHFQAAPPSCLAAITNSSTPAIQNSQEPVPESPQPAQICRVLPKPPATQAHRSTLITPSSISRRRRHCSAPLLVSSPAATISAEPVFNSARVTYAVAADPITASGHFSHLSAISARPICRCNLPF